MIDFWLLFLTAIDWSDVPLSNSGVASASFWTGQEGRVCSINPAAHSCAAFLFMCGVSASKSRSRDFEAEEGIRINPQIEQSLRHSRQ